MSFRLTAPALQQLEKIRIIEAQKTTLDNNIPLYSINAGTQDVVKLILIFPAGEVYNPSGVVASAANHLIDDGTVSKTAAQVAEAFDFYGASLECESDFHQGVLSLYTLTKFLEPTLDLLVEILTTAIYPQSEIDNYKLRHEQQLLVSNEKVDYIARKNFRAALFGTHPYGHTAEIEDFKNLSKDEIKSFHSSNYNPSFCKIIIAGKVGDEQIELLNKKIGALPRTEKNIEEPGESVKNVRPTIASKKFIEKDDAVQSAIRIGKLMVTRTHPDYKKLLLLNTILGGYFGSRLMSNIREDKGYTYGIGSSLIANPFAGSLVIATEAGTEVCNAALSEIYKEIEILTRQPATDEELTIVKNYMTGAFLKSLSGPFELAQRFHTLLTFDLGYEYYYDYLEVLNKTTTEELLELAQKYFQRESFTEVVAGKK